MKLLPIALCLLAFLIAPACVAQPLDPTGSWDTVLTWTGGTCQLSGAVATTMTVARDAQTQGYVITGTQGRQVTGTAVCSESQCQLTFSESGPVPNSQIDSADVSATLTANADGDIIGSGMVVYHYQNQQCHQTFLASGRRGEGTVIQY